MSLLISWMITSLAIVITAYLLPGVHVDSFFAALIVALVLGLMNTFLRPVLIFLTLPLNILTLGLFTLVINAFLVLFVSSVVPGFRVDGWLWALAFSIVLALLGTTLHSIAPA